VRENQIKEKTMDEKLKALKESIEHWERVVENPKKEEIGYKECALCSLYRRNFEAGGCEGCPVYEKTGKHGCHGTPYKEIFGYDFRGRQQEDDNGELRVIPTKEEALKELAFLKDLYIELIEDTPKVGGWVDVTEDIEWELHRWEGSGSKGHCRLTAKIDGKEVFLASFKEMPAIGLDKREYKLEVKDYYFKILKKETK